MSGDNRRSDWVSSEAADAVTRLLLSLILVTIIAFALNALFTKSIPGPNHDVAILIIGGLLTQLTNVFAFSFNTTATSARKDKTISAMATTALTAGAALPTVPGAGSPDVIPLAPGESKTVVGTEGEET